MRKVSSSPEDLVVLVFQSDSPYVGITDLEDATEKFPERFSVNLEDQTWGYSPQINIPIGGSSMIEACGREMIGVVGIYDLKNASHRQEMIEMIIKTNKRQELYAD